MRRYLAIVVCCVGMMSMALAASASDVKNADLAGSWYPKSPAELRALLSGYLDRANVPADKRALFAVIAPHAGSVYSGPIAAYAFKALQHAAPKTVIILGFTHHATFNGIAIYDRGSFRTPLGDVAIDADIASRLITANPRIAFRPDAFSSENSIEMQVPFIQLALPGARIVPIAFGTQQYDDAVGAAHALAVALKDRTDCVIVASTDLSHYRSYTQAHEADAHTIRMITEARARELYDEAKLGVCELCGVMPVTATLLAADELGYTAIERLAYATSGDTAGRKDNVVGYLSAAIYRAAHASSTTQVAEKAKGPTMLNDAQKKRLLQIARESLTSFVRSGRRTRVAETDTLLNEQLGAFVTLHERGELRGCIGNMVGRGPLCQTVADMAIEAATGDPRFQPLRPDEIDRVDIEISVLSPLQKVASANEITIPGHGVIVRRGVHSGVYLPQVATETGWNKEEFLTSLCAHKAGLPPNAWKDPATELYIFTADVFGEKGGGR